MPSTYRAATRSRFHHQGRRWRLGLAALGLGAPLLLAACQAVSTHDSSSPQDDPLAHAPAIEEGLDADSLSSLLLAEFAGQRGDYRRATREYLEMAERLDIPALAERATLAARFSSDPLLLEESVERWQRLAPEADAPMRLLAGLAIQRGNWPEALEQRLALAERGSQADLSGLVELAMEANAELEPLRERLATFLDRAEVELASPHDAELALAMLEAATGQTQRAEVRLDGLAEQHPELPAIWFTRAQLALNADDPERARDAARRGLEIAPDDPRFVLQLAQAELALGNVDAAEARTDALLDSHAGGHQLRLALAQLYIEEGHLEPARRLLLPLTDSDETPAATFALLGAIAETEGEIDNALLYYRQVPPGNEFLNARLNAARMLIDDGRLEDARAFLRIERLRHERHYSDLVALEVELLDERGREDAADELLDSELERTPNDEQLLYLRAMRAWQDRDLEAMERDLERIIEHHPENAMALNALGYTLADLDIEGRLEEARELIERAHELEPDNAAILDSLGWVYFRLGDPQRALPWLERAYAAMPDQEVAAHLAEVLWALDRRDEARDTVHEALERFDEHPLIDELLERIPELSPDASQPDETRS
ncbi:tetratricopeptide repeat protein [Billgrantia gudaonensis]|uniref:Flp pilus assembly protein TadD, contains TPR repeats n=1 Tax=Billgrantia gudaonensis TaxID=376427 RepID=A0A1G8XQW8_9GAMM|nr:tetratricopeptide repeat protein [Halomonas gudaonensis]SDJ92959.1 Flp pilus assembly protein TadD, contains TPR repeats [Halomonas gudaonensis]